MLLVDVLTEEETTIADPLEGGISSTLVDLLFIVAVHGLFMSTVGELGWLDAQSVVHVKDC